MALRHVSRTQLTLTVLSLLGLTWLALMVSSGHPSGQANVLSQLEEPAAAPLARVGPGPVNARLAVAGYSVVVGITPNHAALPQVVRFRLSGPTGAANGAQVSLSYSMPSMNMPSVLTTSLRALAGGVYTTRVTPLVMPGDWLLSFRITPAHGRPLRVELADQMPR